LAPVVFIVMPIVIPLTLCLAVVLPFIAGRRKRA
jgi:hypothetical protein